MSLGMMTVFDHALGQAFFVGRFLGSPHDSAFAQSVDGTAEMQGRCGCVTAYYVVAKRARAALSYLATHMVGTGCKAGGERKGEDFTPVACEPTLGLRTLPDLRLLRYSFARYFYSFGHGTVGKVQEIISLTNSR